MSFDYKKRSDEELEQIAAIVLSRYAHRCDGCFIDIEGIVEDCELTILLRRGGLIKICEGYVAENPHYIVLPEAYTSYLPRYRPILGEELCHVILEYDILAPGGALPADGKPHALTPQQHKDIEDNAHYLSLAILFPRKMFIEKFNTHFSSAPANLVTHRDKHLTYCAEKLESDFCVWPYKAASRARDLKLISDDDFQKYFANRIPL